MLLQIAATQRSARPVAVAQARLRTVAPAPVLTLRRCALRGPQLPARPAAAAIDASAIPQLTDEQRAQLAEQLGYRSIGKDLPSDVTLSDVIKSLPADVSCNFFVPAWLWPRPSGDFRCPRCIPLLDVTLPQVFELNPLRAWSAVLISITSMAACLYLISISPWYLLPFAWALAGTAFTGVSVFGPHHARIHA